VLTIALAFPLMTHSALAAEPSQTQAPASVPAQSPRKIILDDARMRAWNKAVLPQNGEKLVQESPKSGTKEILYIDLLRRQHQMILSDLDAAEEEGRCSYDEWREAVTRADVLIGTPYITIYRQTQNPDLLKTRFNKEAAVLRQKSSKDLDMFNALAQSVYRAQAQLIKRFQKLNQLNETANRSTEFCFNSPVEDLRVFSEEMIACVDLSEQLRIVENKMDGIFLPFAEEAGNIKFQQMNAETPKILDSKTQDYVKEVNQAQEARSKFVEEYSNASSFTVPVFSKKIDYAQDTDLMPSLQRLTDSLDLLIQLNKIDPYLPANEQQAEAQRICAQHNAQMPPEQSLKFFLLQKLEQSERPDLPEPDKKAIINELSGILEKYNKTITSAPATQPWLKTAAEWVQPLADVSPNGLEILNIIRTRIQMLFLPLVRCVANRDNIIIINKAQSQKDPRAPDIIKSYNHNMDIFSTPSLRINENLPLTAETCLKLQIHYTISILGILYQKAECDFILKRWINDERTASARALAHENTAQNKDWNKKAQAAVDNFVNVLIKSKGNMKIKVSSGFLVADRGKVWCEV